MKLYFAGPLFTTPERAWNAEATAALRAAGHDVFLPQENEPGKDAAGIFAADKGGIDGADVMVAIMDGPGPDAGTSWEVGYAFGTRSRSCSFAPTSEASGRRRRRVQPDAHASGHRRTAGLVRRSGATGAAFVRDRNSATSGSAFTIVTMVGSGPANVPVRRVAVCR